MGLEIWFNSCRYMLFCYFREISIVFSNYMGNLEYFGEVGDLSLFFVFCNYLYLCDINKYIFN